MFGIGFLELCVIAVAVLLFVGPQGLPDLMKQFGKFFVQFKRMTNEVKNSVDDVIRDAEKDFNLKNELKELTEVRASVQPSGAHADVKQNTSSDVKEKDLKKSDETDVAASKKMSKGFEGWEPPAD